MGHFIYGNSQAKTYVEDRTLAHLQQVIGTKLRRGECFYFTWKEELSTGGGRRTVWVHPNADLEFRYHGSRSPRLNRDWLEALSLVANSGTGLYVVPEPAPGSMARPVEDLAMRGGRPEDM